MVAPLDLMGFGPDVAYIWKGNHAKLISETAKQLARIGEALGQELPRAYRQRSLAARGFPHHRSSR